MSGQAKFGAVIYAKNLPRMRAFYAGVLGLEPGHSGTGYAILESPDFQLVVHAIPENIASSIEIANPPLRRTQTPIKPVFFVENLAACRQQAMMLGGALDPVDREWRFQESAVCDGHDPEGNVFQLRAHPAAQ